GDVTHRMLTATQYIAPLMANFNPSYSPNSTVQYLDNGTAFVVQWDKVYLQGKEDVGSFTFQAALHRSGRIVFGYKEVRGWGRRVPGGLGGGLGIPGAGICVPCSVPSSFLARDRCGQQEQGAYVGSCLSPPLSPACLQHRSCESCVGSELTFNCSWCHVLQRY
ncbi:PLDX1 protein, partial [Irena cyanogastra]|nr:PLDX1 protein [Irena cyanogastra]